jgi:hypothetical protein
MLRFSIIFAFLNTNGTNDLTNGNIVPQLEGRGHPRLLTAIDCLGLCLAWTRTRGSRMVLQIIFGMTAVPVSL